MEKIWISMIERNEELSFIQHIKLDMIIGSPQEKRVYKRDFKTALEIWALLKEAARPKRFPQFEVEFPR
jgi:hypothetical protein